MPDTNLIGIIALVFAVLGAVALVWLFLEKITANAGSLEAGRNARADARLKVSGSEREHWTRCLRDKAQAIEARNANWDAQAKTLSCAVSVEFTPSGAWLSFPEFGIPSVHTAALRDVTLQAGSDHPERLELHGVYLDVPRVVRPDVVELVLEGGRRIPIRVAPTLGSVLAANIRAAWKTCESQPKPEATA